AARRMARRAADHARQGAAGGLVRVLVDYDARRGHRGGSRGVPRARMDGARPDRRASRPARPQFLHERGDDHAGRLRAVPHDLAPAAVSPNPARVSCHPERLRHQPARLWRGAGYAHRRPSRGRVDVRWLMGIGFTLLAVSVYLLGRINLDISMRTVVWPLVLSGLALGFVFVP